MATALRIDEDEAVAADGLEPVLHAPLRLTIATVLERAGGAEFARVRELAGVSDSVLSKQLAVLTAAGLVRTTKHMMDGRLRTRAELTEAGSVRYRRHLCGLLALVAGVADEVG